MQSVEADGDSIDQAIETALRLLGTTRDKVEIEILANSARGLFGIGSRKARVRATLRHPIDAEFVRRSPPEESSPSSPSDVTAHSDQDVRRKPLERGRERATEKRLAAGPRRTTAETATAGGSESGIAERGRQALQAIIDHIGVEATVVAGGEDDQVVLDLMGDASGVLIGRKGQMLDALEYIVNRIVSRDEGAAARITVDSQNYRARRRETLEELARRMGEQAKKKRRPVTLNPMSPRDRRIVHLILQEDPSLRTRSAGKGYYRKLIILPAGAGTAPRGDG